MKILVIEDVQEHLNDARQYAQNLIGVSVDYATTLEQALALLENNTYDGVISDVFFPAKDGTLADTCENALSISAKLIEMGIHHVFNTMGDHHGREYDQFSHKTPKNIHNHPAKFLMAGLVIETGERVVEMKQWEGAFRYLFLARALLSLPDRGEDMLRRCADKEFGRYHRDETHGAFPLESHEIDLPGFLRGDYGQLTRWLRRHTHPFVLEVFEAYKA